MITRIVFQLDPKKCLGWGVEGIVNDICVYIFWFCFRMIVKGYKKPLDKKDLWSLNRSDQAEVIVPAFEQQWKNEMTKCHKWVSYVWSDWWYIWWLVYVLLLWNMYNWLQMTHLKINVTTHIRNRGINDICQKLEIA